MSSADDPDLLAYEVDADYGEVGAETEDGSVPAIRLLFHHGEDTEARRGMIDELADVLEDLLHGPMGDEIRRVAELFGQIE